ncbi:unnamed protein product, partial [Iphiclides podalirius]
MILLPYASTLYYLAVATNFVQGYIFFAAHLDDLKDVAKKLIPVTVSLPGQKENPASQLGKTNDAANEEYGEAVNYPEYMIVNYRDTTAVPDRVAHIQRSQGRKVLAADKLNIDKLAREIKERVLKELADEFLRFKLNKKRKEIAQKSKYNDPSNERIVEHIETTLYVTTKKPPMRQTKPKSKVKKSRDNSAETTPSGVVVDDFEMEETELGARTNDSYEYYVAPSRDESVFVTVANNPKVSRNTKFRYKIETNNDANTSRTKQFGRRPKLDVSNDRSKGNPNRAIIVKRPTTAGLKYEGGETHILSDVESEERPAPTQKTVRPTRPRFSMSSPNYYASLPTVAERYNFDEPLPESDRRPLE